MVHRRRYGSIRSAGKGAVSLGRKGVKGVGALGGGVIDLAGSGISFVGKGVKGGFRRISNVGKSNRRSTRRRSTRR